MINVAILELLSCWYYRRNLFNFRVFIAEFVDTSLENEISVCSSEEEESDDSNEEDEDLATSAAGRGSATGATTAGVCCKNIKSLFGSSRSAEDDTTEVLERPKRSLPVNLMCAAMVCLRNIS